MLLHSGNDRLDQYIGNIIQYVDDDGYIMYDKVYHEMADLVTNLTYAANTPPYTFRNLTFGSKLTSDKIRVVVDEQELNMADYKTLVELNIQKMSSNLKSGLNSIVGKYKGSRNVIELLAALISSPHELFKGSEYQEVLQVARTSVDEKERYNANLQIHQLFKTLVYTFILSFVEIWVKSFNDEQTEFAAFLKFMSDKSDDGGYSNEYLNLHGRIGVDTYVNARKIMLVLIKAASQSRSEIAENKLSNALKGVDAIQQHHMKMMVCDYTMKESRRLYTIGHIWLSEIISKLSNTTKDVMHEQRPELIERLQQNTDFIEMRDTGALDHLRRAVNPSDYHTVVKDVVFPLTPRTWRSGFTIDGSSRLGGGYKTIMDYHNRIAEHQSTRTLALVGLLMFGVGIKGYTEDNEELINIRADQFNEANEQTSGLDMKHGDEYDNPPLHQFDTSSNTDIQSTNTQHAKQELSETGSTVSMDQAMNYPML